MLVLKILGGLEEKDEHLLFQVRGHKWGIMGTTRED